MKKCDKGKKKYIKITNDRKTRRKVENKGEERENREKNIKDERKKRK